MIIHIENSLCKGKLKKKDTIRSDEKWAGDRQSINYSFQQQTNVTILDYEVLKPSVDMYSIIRMAQSDHIAIQITTDQDFWHPCQSQSNWLLTFNISGSFYI